MKVLGCCFETDGGVVTCGDKHALFWKKEGHCLVKKKGVFGHKATAQMLLCCSRLQGKVECLLLTPMDWLTKAMGDEFGTSTARLSWWILYRKSVDGWCFEPNKQ